jgi:hypothetical protein
MSGGSSFGWISGKPDIRRSSSIQEPSQFNSLLFNNLVDNCIDTLCILYDNPSDI